MKILVVKLSSLGDVVHTMPAVQDMRRALPHVHIDWVVESAFAPLVQRCEGVERVIACDLRRWRRNLWSTQTRQTWRAFKQQLQAQAYDLVIDLQGLTKSALVARMARLTPSGQRVAMANRTDGSAYEAPTRWLADKSYRLPARSHAVTRARELCAQALGYTIPAEMNFGLQAGVFVDDYAIKNIANNKPVALVHGTSRADKEWPLASWVELGHRLHAQGHPVVLVHGNDLEESRSHDLAKQIAGAQVWPRLGLDALTDRLATCAGVVGVDSGLSHIAVALDLPHVQIYNFDTAWRTGPLPRAEGHARQVSVFAKPAPDVDAVWKAWRQVMP